MKILITGGAGFIGSRLSAELVKLGHDVTIFDSLHPQVHFLNETNYSIAKASGAKLIVGDIRTRDDIQRAVTETSPDYIFHLAAETGTGQSFDHPTRYNEVNIIGTTNLIESVRSSEMLGMGSVRRIVLAGSRSVYGEGACVNMEGRPTAAVARTNEDLSKGDFQPKSASGESLTPVPTAADICPVAPASIYASTKLMQEYLLTQAFWGTQTEVGILRLQNVYGPGQSMSNPYTGVISIFADQIMQGKTLNIYEDGEITRDFVYVDDVVRAFASTVALESFSDEIVDIGAGEAATILDVAKEMINLVGDERNGLKITGNFRAGDIRYAIADISKAQALLGWTPQVSVKQGLEQFSKWAKEDQA
ncbi:NAD-dependent epimerase/dehydratase family protein [Aliiruegeria lutimaris]|uniref:dTDP-L-rhamnose 4-epimerase n=1 Tax=Aliiruegeria lutimaris TaxID=571298 RepID=A0A1G9DDY9_9RHOB|nr:NAD-dependent epimerase/dehydratase family protein [Aliiruegeria lutimaris]SDK62049.1 dTDP-L-rhamnose 4-epimerase [Aliiruegeria lutimaris]